MRTLSYRLYLYMITTAVTLALCIHPLYAHEATYQTSKLTNNKLKITIKPDPNEKKGISITHFYLTNGKVLNIGYELKDNAPKAASFDFDMAGAIPPIRIVLSNINKPNAMPFEDVANIEAKEYIRHLHDAGIINGGPDGRFNPDKPITRAEFVVLMVKALNIEGTAKNTKGYKDIDKHWAKNTLLLASQSGLISGYADKTLKPNNPITVAEVCAVISKSFQFKTNHVGIYSKVKQNMWYSDVVEKMFDAGILSVNDSIYKYFNEKSNINRANSAMMISRALSTY